MVLSASVMTPVAEGDVKLKAVIFLAFVESIPSITTPDGRVVPGAYAPVKSHAIQSISAFTVFILPLIATSIGVLLGRFIGQYIGSNINVFQIIGGIIAFLLSMIFVKLFDRAATISEKSKPEIISILL